MAVRAYSLRSEIEKAIAGVARLAWSARPMRPAGHPALQGASSVRYRRAIPAANFFSSESFQLRSNTAMLSTCAVCGNILTTPAALSV